MRCLLTLAVLLAVALTGCHSAGDRTVIADEAMDGKRITVHSGDVIELKLPENPSTGYRWLPTDDFRPALLTEMGSTYIGDAAASGIVGAGGTRIWRYRADHIGECTLQFGLVPPGRSPGPEDDRYRITVVVAD